MIKQRYSELRQFYRSDFRHQLIITAAAFLALIVIGYIVGFARPDIANGIVEQFSQQVADLGLQEADVSINAFILFASNFRAMLMSICYGFIPFIRLPALSLGMNSILIGLFGAYSIQNGLSLTTYLCGILPHGIFEFPALILSLSCALYLCQCVTDSVRSKEKGMIKQAVHQIARVVALHVVPLLLAAAIVEAYITPQILKLFL